MTQIQEPITVPALQRLAFRFDGDDQWSNRYIILMGSGTSWALTIAGGSGRVYLGGIVTSLGQLKSLMTGLGITVQP